MSLQGILKPLMQNNSIATVPASLLQSIDHSNTFDKFPASPGRKLEDSTDAVLLSLSQADSVKHLTHKKS